MKLTRSEQANPQDYYLQSGVDSIGNPIYDLLNQLVDDYLPAKAIRKKVFDGNADIVISADTVHIYWKGDLIAQAQLEGQVETSPSVWQGQFFSFADANIKKIDYRENLPNWLISNFYSLGDEVLHNEINYRCIKSHGYAFYSESSESSSEESASLSSSSEGSSNSSSLSKESMSSSSSSEGSKSSSSSSWSSSSQSSESSISLNQESVEPGITVGWEVYWKQLDPITPFYRAFEVKDIPALGIVDAVFGMDCHWAFKDTKLSFYLDAPGFNSRIRWQCRVKDSAVAWTDNTDPNNPVYHKGLSFNVSDYKSETTSIIGESIGTSADGIYTGILSNFPIKKATFYKNGKIPTDIIIDNETGNFTVTFDRTLFNSESELNEIGTLSVTPIVAGSVIFNRSFDNYDSGQKIIDNGDGILSGDGNGTINYMTGDYSLIWDVAPNVVLDISAVYQFLDTNEYEAFCNYDYYPNTVNHGSQADPETGWTQHWWTFEPNGKQMDTADARTPLERYEQGAGIVVDPYLSVDEQATYFDIAMDGVVARIWNNGSEAFIGKIYDKDAVGTTDLFSFGSKVVVGGTTYCLSEDTGIVVTVVENTPLRVVLRAQGDFETSAQSSLANEADSVLWMTFYPDKIVMRIKFNVTASITLSDNAANGLIFMDSVIGNLTAEDSKYESGGSETDAGGDGSQASADYIATSRCGIKVWME
jgi:hypothetical protein